MLIVAGGVLATFAVLCWTLRRIEARSASLAGPTETGRERAHRLLTKAEIEAAAADDEAAAKRQRMRELAEVLEQLRKKRAIQDLIEEFAARDRAMGADPDADW